jgi:hypothetical protein
VRQGPRVPCDGGCGKITRAPGRLCQKCRTEATLARKLEDGGETSYRDAILGELRAAGALIPWRRHKKLYVRKAPQRTDALIRAALSSTRSRKRSWEWQDRAACRQSDDSYFVSSLPERKEVTWRTIYAVSVCDGALSGVPCPVRVECLAAGIVTRDGHGVRGGLTPHEWHAALSRQGVILDDEEMTA